MGGTKKPTITKMKKMAMREKVKKKQKEEIRKIEYRALIDGGEIEKLKKYVLKQKYVTPYQLSKKGEIKVSIARRLLRGWASEGLLKLDMKNRELEIYVPIA